LGYGKGRDRVIVNDQYRQNMEMTFCTIQSIYSVLREKEGPYKSIPAGSANNDIADRVVNDVISKRI